MMFSSPRLAALALGLALTGCKPDTSHLEVDATITDPALSIAPSAFGTATDPQGILSGTFTLVLTLGGLANEPADVQPRQFTLVRASDQNDLGLTPIPTQATDPQVIHVGVGEKQQHVYTFTYDNPQPINALCQAGQVMFTGSVYEQSENEPKPIQSTPFTITGCP